MASRIVQSSIPPPSQKGASLPGHHGQSGHLLSTTPVRASWRLEPGATSFGQFFSAAPLCSVTALGNMPKEPIFFFFHLFPREVNKSCFECV